MMLSIYLLWGRVCLEDCQRSALDTDYLGDTQWICNVFGKQYPGYFYIDQLYNTIEDPYEVKLKTFFANHFYFFSKFKFLKINFSSQNSSFVIVQKKYQNR